MKVTRSADSSHALALLTGNGLSAQPDFPAVELVRGREPLSPTADSPSERRPHLAMRGWPPRAQCHNNIIQNRTRAAQVKILRDTDQLDSRAHAAGVRITGEPGGGDLWKQFPLSACTAALPSSRAGRERYIALGPVAAEFRAKRGVCGVARRIYGPGRHSRGCGLGRAGRGKKVAWL